MDDSDTPGPPLRPVGVYSWPEFLSLNGESLFQRCGLHHAGYNPTLDVCDGGCISVESVERQTANDPESKPDDAHYRCIQGCDLARSASAN